jgi:hypothetical protein
MNLPHEKPIRFVQKLIRDEEEKKLVNCEFPCIPTLAMICEAAAQSSVSFANTEEVKIGFLVSLKNIELLEELKTSEYLISITKGINLGDMNEYIFSLLDENEKKYASGSLIIVIQDEVNI